MLKLFCILVFFCLLDSTNPACCCGVSNCLESCRGDHEFISGSTNYAPPCSCGYDCDPGFMAACTDYFGSMVCTCVICVHSYYCPNGCQLRCPPGYKCDRPDLFAPRFCIDNVTTKGGVFSSTGWFAGDTCPFELCHAGYYCPISSMSARGHRYAPGTLNPELNDKLILKGYYCPGGCYTEKGHIRHHLATPADYERVCQEKYYCPSGSVSGDGKCIGDLSIKKCCKGFFCLKGSYNCQGSSQKNGHDFHYCPAGKYCPEETGSVHSNCQEGYVCNGAAYTKYGEDIFDDSIKKCPRGYYCEEGSSNISMKLCPAGKYCPEGTGGVLLDCEEGYMCDEGSYSRFGEDIFIGDVKYCTEGYFCEKSTSNSTKEKCSEGFYCLERSINSFGGNVVDKGNKTCHPGYHCPIGSFRSTQRKCPKNFKCPKGIPIACEDGKFADEGKTLDCCFPGYYHDTISLRCNITTCQDIFNNDTSSVCSGNGNCAKRNHCDCKSNYFGENCNVTLCYDVHSNQSRACGVHGNCEDFDKCDCLVNYFGDFCNITTCFGIFSNETDVCHSNGICNANNICNCFPNYYGKYCNVTSCHDIFSNISYSCGRYGFCSDFNKCWCSMGYFGDFCNITSCYDSFNNNSKTQICSNHGSCSKKDQCDCFDGYFGKLCNVTRCFDRMNNESGTCSNHGICENVDNCNCKAEYYGSLCDISTCEGVLSNSSRVCSNNGDCVNGKCECKKNYYGINCAVTQCFGEFSNSSFVCNGNGKCQMFNECNCHKDQYFGKNCDITKCFGRFSNVSDPRLICSNHGNCTSYNECFCISNYYGGNCNVTKCFDYFSNHSQACSGRGRCSSSNVCQCNKCYHFGKKCENITNCNGVFGNSSNVCGGKYGCCEWKNGHSGCSCYDEEKYVAKGSNCVEIGFLGSSTNTPSLSNYDKGAIICGIIMPFSVVYMCIMACVSCCCLLFSFAASICLFPPSFSYFVLICGPPFLIVTIGIYFSYRRWKSRKNFPMNFVFWKEFGDELQSVCANDKNLGDELQSVCTNDKNLEIIAGPIERRVLVRFAMDVAVRTLEKNICKNSRFWSKNELEKRIKVYMMGDDKKTKTTDILTKFEFNDGSTKKLYFGGFTPRIVKTEESDVVKLKFTGFGYEYKIKKGNILVLNYRGGYLLKMRHGTGEIFAPKGNKVACIYSGKFLNGKKHGLGQEHNILTGRSFHRKYNRGKSVMKRKDVLYMKIGEHELPKFTEVLGGGAYGIVWRMETAKLPERLRYHINAKYVAIKIFLNSGNAFKKGISLSDLFRNKRNMLKMYGLVVDSEDSNIIRGYIMEHYKETLYEVLKRGNITTDEKKRILFEIGKGLQCLSKEKILHRDITNKNIAVGSDGRMVIIDIDRMIEENTSTSMSLDGIGTESFLAPEIIREDGDYSKFTTPYEYNIKNEICCMKHEDCKDSKIWKQHIAYCEYRPSLNMETPKGLAPHVKLMKRMWSSIPKERPSIDEIVNILGNFCEDNWMSAEVY